MEYSALKPEKVFTYFKEISQIPRRSGQEKLIADYLEQFAHNHSLECMRDSANNILIIKKASEGFENHEPLILQGHMDMVCVADEGKNIDFDKESVSIVVDGDYIKADGTTLGADNGIALAYMLAVLEDDEIAHPRLECLMTSSEEIGLMGAQAFEASRLTGRRMINLDSEEEYNMVAGCAGGITVNISLPIKRVSRRGMCYDLIIEGLQGGHSGADIDKHRANANILMARILKRLSERYVLYVSEWNGGDADNAICNKCVSKFAVSVENAHGVERTIPQIVREFEEEYETCDPGIKVVLSKRGEGKVKAFSKKSLSELLFILYAAPNGIVSMSGKVKGMVETSLNCGIVKCDGMNVSIVYLIRSNVGSAKSDLANRVKVIAESVGARVRFESDYPGWDFNVNSKLREIILPIYKEHYGKDINVITIHAGLECGIFAGRLEELDVISIGPNLYDVHTINERASISSIEKFWYYLIDILKAC